MPRYMRKIDSTMIFPYDDNPDVLRECVVLPDGFNPVTGKIEKVEESEQVEQVEVKKAEEEKPEPLFTIDSTDMFLDTSDNYNNMKRAQLIKMANERNIKTNITDTRDILIDRLVSIDKDEFEKSRIKNL